jgi:hypothetical protein
VAFQCGDSHAPGKRKSLCLRPGLLNPWLQEARPRWPCFVRGDIPCDERRWSVFLEIVASYLVDGRNLSYVPRR